MATIESYVRPTELYRSVVLVFRAKRDVSSGVAPRPRFLVAPLAALHLPVL